MSDYGHIPAELRELRQWVIWRLEERNGKRTKVPYRVTSSTEKASTADPATWASYDLAVLAATTGRDIDGIGFVFTADDPYVGVDLDGCIEPGEPFTPTNWRDGALDVVRQLGARGYREHSPSGRGTHFIVRGSLNGNRNRTSEVPWGGGLEVYDRGRFFTVTGDVTGQVNAEIVDAQDWIDWLEAEFLPPPPKEAPRESHAREDGAATDAQVLHRAMSAKSGEAFSVLWNGGVDGHGSESEADLALCGMLSFWTGPDPDRIDALFRKSGLMRNKWEREDYAGRTITKALDGRTEFYDWSKANGSRGSGTAPKEPPAPAVPAPPTADILEAVGVFINRFVVLPSRASYLALALFVLHTWAFKAAHATPYFVIESPEKQSGKTRVLEVLQLICRNPAKAASVTAAALFQTISSGQPTLLIDEADAIFGGGGDRNEELRGILNAGNVPGSPVIRGGRDGTPIPSETFAPKVIAGIATGKLPDTIRDRAIVVPIDRKLRTQRVERLRRHRLTGELDRLRAQLQAWAEANLEHLHGYDLPEPLEAISDRLEEAWEPLLAIADLAGGEYPARARAAVEDLAEDGEDDATTSYLLLMRLHAVFRFRAANFSREICDELNRDENLPFGSWNDDKGIRPSELARQLKRYRARPRTIRLGNERAKGYAREQLESAWRAYGADFPVTPVTTPGNTGDSGGSSAVTNAECHGYENDRNPREHWDVTGGTAKSAPEAPESESEGRWRPHRPKCSCATPGLPDEDGRCSRCYGELEDR